MFVVVLAIVGCNSETVPPSTSTQSESNPSNAGDSPAGNAPSFQSPEATFEAAKAAVQQNDYVAFSECHTPAGWDQLAGGMVMLSRMVSGFSEKAAEGDSPEAAAAKKRMELVAELLKKHSINVDDIPSISLHFTDDNQEEVDQQVREHLSTIAKLIPDNTSFVADVVAMMEAIADQPGVKMLPEDSQLTELVVDGDNATAVITKQRGERVRKCPVTFSKVDGQWKIVEIKGLAN